MALSGIFQAYLIYVKSILMRICNIREYPSSLGLPWVENIQDICLLEKNLKAILGTTRPDMDLRREMSNFYRTLMIASGCSINSAKRHRDFYEQHVLPNLQLQSTSATAERPHWRSFMNDDHTPIELSLSWGPRSHLPIVRYGVEAIGEEAGTAEDPFNLTATRKLVSQIARANAMVDLSWYDHFSKALLPDDRDLGTPLGLDTNDTELADHQSSVFLALDSREDGLGLKVYFIPGVRASQNQQEPLELVTDALHQLPQDSTRLCSSFDQIRQYAASIMPEHRPRFEMLAIDCIDPIKARIKVYLRSPRTSFQSVLETMCLGGRLPPLPAKATDTLRRLWHSLLGLSNQTTDTEALPSCAHRTAGIIYHFDIRLGKQSPHCKVYIPVKHYARDDWQVASAFGAFLTTQNKGIKGSSYEDLVASLCAHRRLEDGLGFHTYISADVHGEELAVTSYVQPEFYHLGRHTSH